MQRHTQVLLRNCIKGLYESLVETNWPSYRGTQRRLTSMGCSAVLYGSAEWTQSSLPEVPIQGGRSAGVTFADRGPGVWQNQGRRQQGGVVCG